MNSRPRGRRPGQPDTRQQILDVARRRFQADGYAAVSLRAIAAEAGVDVALVSYYFGSKRGLLGATLSLGVSPADALTAALEGDPATFAPRLLSALIGLWDDPVSGPQLRALLHAAAQEESIAGLAADLIEREMIDTLASRLRGPHARVRAAAFFSMVTGLLVSRYLLGVQPLASLSRVELVRAFSPALTQTLSEPGPHRLARR